MANPKKMRIEVVERTGPCFYEYKAGDKWDITGLKTPEGGFCGAAYHTLFPVLFALNFGAKYPFMKDVDSLDTVVCPDGGYVRFKAKRME